jgi:hypothetical protein
MSALLLLLLAVQRGRCPSLNAGKVALRWCIWRAFHIEIWIWLLQGLYVYKALQAAS